MAQCFAIFVPTHEAAARDGVGAPPQVYFDEALRRFREEIEANEDVIRPALTASQIERNFAQGKMSAVLTVEDGVTIDGRLENVDRYAQLGVRMVALTWNYENCLGFPNSEDPALNARGLKPFGRDAVRRMNELGIAVDVSHLSEGGFWDVARVSQKPFVASHSCAKALCGHRRNLTDEQLRALAEKGGVCGVNFMAQFLHEDQSDSRSTIRDVMANLVHIKNAAGIDVLAIGSDYDGIGSTLEWGDWSGSRMLVDAMQAYFTDDEIEKICWKNALRTFRDIIGA